MDGKKSKAKATAYFRKHYAATPLWSGERRDTARASVQPSTPELYWAAGFLEGEGCFRTDPKGSMSVSATQVETEPLLALQRLFGGRITKKHMSARNRQQPHGWGVYGARAAGVALTLHSLMSSRRREQIERAIANRRPACHAALNAVEVPRV